MKKIALCSLMACMCVSGAGAATYNCNVQEISSLSFKVSNEFLFPTYGDHSDANGRAFVCGHRETNGCDSGAMVLISGEHYFTEIIYEDGLYRCSTNGGNAWARADKNILPKCTDDQIKTFTLFDDTLIGKRRIYCKDAVGTYKAGGRCVGRSAGDICWTDYCPDCEKAVENQCTFSDGSKHNLGESVEYDCSQSPDTPVFRQNSRTGIKCYQSCLKRKSDNKLTNYWSVKTCPKGKGFVAFDSSDYQKYTPDIPGYKRCDNASELPEIVVTPDIKSCKEKRTTAEGKACCDLPASEAKWENNQCKCLNDKEFKIVDGRGTCVAKEQPVNEGDCLYKLTMDVKCNNGNTYYKGQELPITKEQAERLGGCDRVKSDIDSLGSILAVSKKEITQMQEIIKLVCGNSATSISPVVVVNYDEEKIKRAQDTLSNFASRASKEASGWKTEDGKFNTMRLASDLSAGVVLGTVGGVVSGVVIKKKQVEKGFDALHCTVGGQTIADWGDTFSVGLQR